MEAKHGEVQLVTPGVIADKLGVPIRRVLYVLSSRGHIHPAARAGILRLFDSKAIQQIQVELEAIANRKGKG